MVGFRGSFSRFSGVNIYIHDFGSDRVQYRRPRSKKRRIRRKWAADPRNWRTTPIRGAYRMGDRFIVDPLTYAELAASMETP